MAVHAEAGHAHAISKNSTLAQATNVRSAWLTLFTRSTRGPAPPYRRAEAPRVGIGRHPLSARRRCQKTAGGDSLIAAA